MVCTGDTRPSLWGGASVWPARSTLFHFRCVAPSSSCSAISSSPKDILVLSWHGPAYLRLLPEPVAFSHINSISGDFSFLSVLDTFSPFCMVHSLLALEKPMTNVPSWGCARAEMAFSLPLFEEKL